MHGISSPQTVFVVAHSITFPCAENINQKVINAEYAVRGPIVMRGMMHEEALRKGEKR
jgi:hypothetical protein